MTYEIIEAALNELAPLVGCGIRCGEPDCECREDVKRILRAALEAKAPEPMPQDFAARYWGTRF